jgi:hypothetical protein
MTHGPAMDDAEIAQRFAAARGDINKLMSEVDQSLNYLNYRPIAKSVGVRLTT